MQAILKILQMWTYYIFNRYNSISAGNCYINMFLLIEKVVRGLLASEHQILCIQNGVTHTRVSDT